MDTYIKSFTFIALTGKDNAIFFLSLIFACEMSFVFKVCYEIKTCSHLNATFVGTLSNILNYPQSVCTARPIPN